MRTRSNAKSSYKNRSNKRKRQMNHRGNKTAPISNEFWIKTAEDHKKILNLGNDHKCKSEKLEKFTNEFLKKHVRITLQSTIGQNTQLFQTPTNANDEYVYNIDINVNELSDDSSKLELEDFTPWFQIKKSQLGSDTSNNYGLFSMREFKKDEYIGMYFGRMIERNSQIESKEKDNYRFKDLTCKHEDSFIGLHFMNDPLFQLYDIQSGSSFVEVQYIESQKKARKNVTNAVLQNDYLVSAKVRIKKYSEITTYYDWHIDRQSDGIQIATL